MSGGFLIGSAEAFYRVCMYLNCVFRDLIWSVGILIGFVQYHLNQYQSWITLNKPCGNGFLQNLNNLELILALQCLGVWSQTKFGFGTCDQEITRWAKALPKHLIFKTSYWFQNYFHFPFSTLILYFLKLHICPSTKKWPLGEAQSSAENGYGSNYWKSRHPQPKCKFENPS